MIDPLVSRALSVAFALLLLLAAWHKVSAQFAFRAALAEYRLLPQMLLPAAGVLIPASEALLGFAWLAGYGSSAALLTAALLSVYATAIAINLRRGRVHIGCGCGFGGRSGEDPPLSWWLVARNLLLGALALLGARPVGDRVLGVYDWLTLVLATIAAAALFVGGSQLLRNHTAMAAWRTPRD